MPGRRIVRIAAIAAVALPVMFSAIVAKAGEAKDGVNLPSQTAAMRVALRQVKDEANQNSRYVLPMRSNGEIERLVLRCRQIEPSEGNLDNANCNPPARQQVGSGATIFAF